MIKSKINKCVCNLLVVAILFLQFTYVANAAAESTLYFNPATVTTTNGSSFTVSPTINTGGNAVSIVSLKMTFDSTKLALTNISVPAYSASTPFYNSETAGFDPADPTGSLATFIANANSTGHINFDLSVGTSHSSATGIFSVAALTFSVTSTGFTQLDYAASSGAGADGVSGNAVTSSTSLDVTIDGPEATYSVGGSVTGLNGTLVLQNNGGNDLSISANGNFNFTQTLSDNSNYIASILSQPSGQTCSIVNNSGTISGGDITNVSVNCTTDAVAIPTLAIASSSSSDSNDGGGDSSKKKASPARSIKNSRTKVTRGMILVQTGKKFSKASFVALYFSKPFGGYYPPTKVKTSKTGAFAITYRVNKPRGTYTWYAVDLKTGRKSKTAKYSVK